MFGLPSVQMKRLDAGPINLMRRTSQSLLRIQSTVAAGHFEYETFNAAQAVITIEGTSVHPGTAYGSLVNAIKLGEQLDQSLPQKEVPEQTRGNEGFYLLNKFTGSIEKQNLSISFGIMIKKTFKRESNFGKQVQRLNALADKPRLTITFQDQYYNMKEIIEKIDSQNWPSKQWKVVTLNQSSHHFVAGQMVLRFLSWAFPRLIYLQVARIFMGNMNSLPLNQWPKLFRRSLPSFA